MSEREKSDAQYKLHGDHYFSLMPLAPIRCAMSVEAAFIKSASF